MKLKYLHVLFSDYFFVTCAKALGAFYRESLAEKKELPVCTENDNSSFFPAPSHMFMVPVFIVSCAMLVLVPYNL